MKNLISLLFLCSLPFAAFSNTEPTDTATTEIEFSEEMYMAAYRAYTDSLEQTYEYETGVVNVGDGIANLQVPADFKYLNGKDSEFVLTEIWGNPPNDPADQSLGMLIPANESIFNDSSFVINITYSEDGYIDDSDAKDIDYDDLLDEMQSDTEASNEFRLENGYPTIKLVGWAADPYYDSANKKLHWAKELNFDESSENTLNYNIRILGRRGYLQLNAIGEMYVLGDVNNNIEPILSSVNFNEGHRYGDFNPDMDQVAAYGIGGLIAGKVLAKTGLLATIGIFLAKAWKLILVALVAFGGAIGKFFKKKETV